MNNTTIYKGKFQGYLWKSDNPDPEVFNNVETTIVLPLGNPFIIEGQLFDEHNRISVSIKYIDGNYIISEYKLGEIDKELESNYTMKEYLSNKMEYRMLCFRQYWRKNKDEFCENMPTLMPAQWVFVGFKI